MATMLGAVWQGAHHDNGVMSRYDIVCVHTIVGYAPAHAAHFSTNAGGTIFQSRDTAYRSAANLNGNARVLAVENEDHGPSYGSWSGSNVPAFTNQQIESIAHICAWANATHGIPLVQCPNSRPGSRGIAFHRQGIPGNFANGLVPGGEVWSTSAGKVCPGDRRIAQMPQIIARARQLAGLDTTPASEEGDPMFQTFELPPATEDEPNEVTIALPWQGGSGGVNKVFAMVCAGAGGALINVAHWQRQQGAGPAVEAIRMQPDGTEVPARGRTSGAQAPAGVHALIINYIAPEGGSVVIEGAR